jgi:hypothetical protein
MAAPHTAGIALLVRQAHPTWGPIAIKGALMSTANPAGVGDFSVRRGGTGLVSATNAVDTVAYMSTSDGRNNLAFGFRQLSESWSATKTITITNTSRSAITYDVAAKVNTLGLTGLSVSVNPAVAKVDARGSRTIEVTIRIKDPQDLPIVDADNAGALATISGLVTATPRGSAKGVHALRAPLMLVPYGLSDIQATGISRGRGNTPAPVSTIRLGNDGVHYGSYDTYQWAITDPAGDNGDPRVGDVRDVGVQQFPIQGGDLLVFAASLNNRVTTHATQEYDLYIDTTGDGNADFVAVTIDNGLFTGGAPDGLVETFLLDLSNFKIVDAWDAYAPANGSVVEMPMLVQSLGPITGPISFELETYSVVATLPPDVTDVGSYDPANPAVSMGAFDYLDPHTSALLPVTADTTAAAAQGALGWLVVSVDDAAGSREADRVPLKVRPNR